MKVRKGMQWPGVAVVMVALLCGVARASMGDHLPEFKQCVRVCMEANCGEGKGVDIRMFNFPQCTTSSLLFGSGT